MTATVLRASERVVQPWKNGGGRTREVIASPASGVAGDFDWRISMADVEMAGPFSSFPGIDRTLRVLEGRLELSFADPASVHVLTPDTAALAFPGDVPVSGRPVGGPVLDLNLMVRRNAFRGSILRQAAGPVPIPKDDMTALVVIAREATTLQAGDQHLALDRFDALSVDTSRPAAAMTVDQAVLVIRICARAG